jgi:intracellular septation protein A
MSEDAPGQIAEKSTAPIAGEATPAQENPFADIIINVLVPVLVLSYLSKEGDAVWNIGPMWAMFVALAIPIGYGIWHYLKYRQMNVFSLVGLFSVVLTGAITIYLWSGNASVRKNAALLFGIKEAVQPLVLGSLLLITHKMSKPLFNVFVYNDAIFDLPQIEAAIAERGTEPDYKRLLWKATLLFFGAFLISSVLNLGLAFYFLGDLDPLSADWKELYNKDVAKITGWGFVVIGAPILVVGGCILWYLVTGLKRLTGLDTETILEAL